MSSESYYRAGSAFKTTEKWRKADFHAYAPTNYSYGTATSGSGLDRNFYGRLEVLTSEGHPYFYLGKTRLNLGGPFEVIKQTVSGPLVARTLRSIGIQNQWSNEYSTIVLPSGAVASALDGITKQADAVNARGYLIPKIPGRPSETTMDAMGAQAINMVNPTNSVAELATSVAEFVSERKLFALPTQAGSLPGEYLNYMFGIAPTIGLAKDFREAAINREKITKQYIRDAGKWVRRRADFPEQRTTTSTKSTGYPYGYGIPLSTSVARVGQLRTTTRQVQRFWFSGAFTYYLPKEGTRAFDVAILDKLYGVRAGGTEIAWELLPFSWLADYKLSIGASLQNIESFSENGIVMPYAYIMCHTRTEVEYDWVGEVKDHLGSWTTAHFRNTVTTESKMRRAANPFGFGLKASDLSPKQWSILAALGLTLADRR